jgi:glycosyltransferase involved in cell wall biosynthesis
MNIAHIITCLDTGGAEMMLYKILSASDRQFFSQSVISLTDEGTIGSRIKGLGVPVYCLGMKHSIPSPSSLLRLAQVVRTIRPGIIQGWMYHGNLLSLLASKVVRQPTPVIWNIRQSLYSLSYEKPLTRMVIRCGAMMSKGVARILYNSSTGARHHGDIGYDSAKSQVIPNGFDTDTFVPSKEARAAVRKELGLDTDALLIGLIGRYHPMKDHGTFLRAAARLHERFPEVYFLLAGSKISPQNEQLQGLISEGGLSDKVRLLGERHDIPRLTAALDCAALSSFAEGFPNVVGEAMSCAVPCAVTDVGDAAWVVGSAGIVVPPRDPEALASAWGELIGMSPEKRMEMGQKGRERIIEHFSLHSVMQQYERIYEEVAV